MKTMNLDELRKELASDATEKVKQQERYISKLKHRLKEKDEELDEKNKVLRTMFNRCMAQSHGVLCFFCGHQNVCDALQSVLND